MVYDLVNEILKILYDLAIIVIHWSRDKMAAILQMTFSSAFSQMKTFEF